MSVDPEAWTAIGVGISAVAAALSAVAVARINATKTDVGEAKQQASEANSAAVEARELSRPTSNGFAEHMRAALDRIERRQEAEAVASRKAAELLAEHLHDHARAGIRHEH